MILECLVDLGCVQGLTWLLPEKFSASEIGPEAGFSMLLFFGNPFF